MNQTETLVRCGIVAGPYASAQADAHFLALLNRLAGASTASANKAQREFLMAQDTQTATVPNRPSVKAQPAQHKLYVFNQMLQLAKQSVQSVALPCIDSHTFIDEMQAELHLPIWNMLDALCDALQQKYPHAKRVGVVTSENVQLSGVFDRSLAQQHTTCLYPATCAAAEGGTAAQLQAACAELQQQGADVVVVAGANVLQSEAALQTIQQADPSGLPVIDLYQVYAEYITSHAVPAIPSAFKIGIVGGVGPAATVDFLSKIVRHTPASKDQDHFKVVVEQNPQIPDRTANLIGDGVDPTIALYATCKRLEAAQASIITIPCNTAHAFVERIQPYLGIPVIHMLTSTIEHIQATQAPSASIGLLATNGTIGSGIYAKVARQAGIELMVPDAEHQSKVMNAIYGERGVKAGFTDGECREELLAAVAHLVERGARAVILGCTELPLILQADEAFEVAGHYVALLDPTEILAKKCVQLGLAHGQAYQP